MSWDVATDDTMRNVVRTGLVEADRRFAYSVHVEVGGLEPGRPYWYRFTALGQQSPIGRTKTAPAPRAEPERMRLAFASCSNWEMGYFSAYRHMAEENPDLVIFLGDYIYEVTYPDALADRIVRKHDGPTATDLASYRNRHALYRTDADLQALHAASPVRVTPRVAPVSTVRTASVTRSARRSVPAAVGTARRKVAVTRSCSIR